MWGEMTVDARHVRMAPVSTSMSVSTPPTVTGRNHSRGAEAERTVTSLVGVPSQSKATWEALYTSSSSELV